MKLTGHSPTEVGVAEKLLPSPRESGVSGNVQGLAKTPVGSASLVREAIPGDLLSKPSTISHPGADELSVSVTAVSNVPELPDVPVVPDAPDVPELPVVPDIPVLYKVYFVPKLSHSLLSVNSLTRQGMTVEFSDDKVVISQGQSKVEFEDICAFNKDTMSVCWNLSSAQRFLTYRVLLIRHSRTLMMTDVI